MAVALVCLEISFPIKKQTNKSHSGQKTGKRRLATFAVTPVLDNLIKKNVKDFSFAKYDFSFF